MINAIHQLSARPRRAGLVCLVLGLAIVGLPGCGQGKGSVSGTVKYNGQPLKFGTVQIESSAGSVHFGTINSDGTYSVDDVPSGPARVAVSAVDENAVVKAAQDLSAKSRGGLGRLGKKGGAGAPQTGNVVAADDPGFSAIPVHYSDFAQSGLTVEVNSGKTSYDIELQ
jgi:hypothetical protein